MSALGIVEIGLTAVYGGEHIRARLVYDACNPLEVRLILQGNAPSDGEVTWLFGRDLLIDGLKGCAGDGDVRIWPLTEDKVAVSVFGSEDGGETREWATMVIRRVPVVNLLVQSFRLVPQGMEARYLNIGAELADFLGAP
jgi:hypothetical protein